jgi:cysteine-rich repeat protein
VCGDGFVGPGEACDDGNQSNDDACTNVCKLATCGDGFKQQGEECDAGANNSNVGACTLACKLPKCGDQFVQPSNMEECDDGNLSNTDGCVGSCKLAKCGDAFVQMGAEQCDDGNQVNTDACTNTCKARPAATRSCSRASSATTATWSTRTRARRCARTAVCGDAIVQAGVEQCDDGNAVNTDACVAGCKAAKCGDGFVLAGRSSATTATRQQRRVQNGMGGSISGTFMDPVPPGKVVKSVLVKAGVEHACNAGQSMLFRYENTQIGTWGAGNGPDCQCGNPAVGNASFNAPINLYKVGQNNSVSIFHNAGGSCHEAITNVPGAPVGTAFQVVITYSGC